MLSIEDFQKRVFCKLRLLQQLVEIESPSREKAAVDRMGARVMTELHQLGASITIDKQATTGDHIIGHWGNSQGIPILFLCHMDTVYPLGTIARQPWIEKEGEVWGPGVMDMKGGIALLLSVLGALRENGQWPSRPITALFTSDEEIGSDTSRSIIEHLARQAGLVLCMEPALPDGSLKTWRKGIGEYEMIARGRAAHAGADHEKGRNAIEELAYQVIAIQKMTDYVRGTTLNVGMIGGGTASNVVPAEARAVIDVRVMIPDEAERIDHALRALDPILEGTTLEIRGGLNRPPMPRDDRMILTFNKAQGIADQLGIKLRAGGTGGGSDANFVAPFGVPILDGLGVQGDGEHSEREHIYLSSLPQKMALLAALITEW